MKKRMFALALAAALASTFLPTAAMAEEGWTVTKLTGLEYDDVLTLYDNMALVKKNGLGYGFVDTTGKEIVPCQYEDATAFYGGRAAVSVDGKWGFIDLQGQIVIPPVYDRVAGFEDELAAVRRGEKWGFIDKSGKEVIPCGLPYDGVYYGFYNGLARVYYGFSQDYYGNPTEEGKMGCLDLSGREVVPCVYDWIEGVFEGRAAVRVGDWETGKWGFIDMEGKEVVPCQYEQVEDYSHGFAMVMKDGKWGAIDLAGKEVIPCIYDECGLHGFADGLCPVRLGDTWRYINEAGEDVFLCPEGTDYACAFTEGLGVVQMKDGTSRFVDKTGKEPFPCRYNEGVSSFDGFVATVRHNGKEGIIDRRGNEVLPCQYDSAWLWVESGLGVVGMLSGEVDEWGGPLYKWGLISASYKADAVAYPSTQEVDVDGEKITFQCYALKDENGNDTNYIKLRDLADILNGGAAQFAVGWNGNVTITTGQSYTPNGTEQHTPFSGQRTYQTTAAQTLVNGAATDLAAFTLTDDNGGGYTYYKLRDLGDALGFKVDWSKDRGIFIETK